MPRKVSRKKRGYFAKVLKERTSLPIELWKLIFLFVRNTISVARVNKSFRSAILDLHFHREWSQVHKRCSVDWCREYCYTFYFSGGKTAKYCPDHLCNNCKLNHRRVSPADYPIQNEYCKDCEYICDEDGCGNQALLTKESVNMHLMYWRPVEEKWYCYLHGCENCGRPRLEGLECCMVCYDRYFGDDF